MNSIRRPCVLVAVVLSGDPVASALQLCRPHVEVIQAAPEDLAVAVLQHRPRLVIHDVPSETVEASAAWVLLYPRGENVGVVCVDGEPQSIPSITFADLLAAVDAAIDEGIGHPPHIGACPTHPQTLPPPISLIQVTRI